MTLLTRHSRKQTAGALVMTLVITGLIGFLLASYLTLVRSQNASTMRSQSWNAVIPVIEAGIEEALSHLAKHDTDPTLQSQGWEKVGDLNVYAMRRHLGQNYYEVTISNWVSGNPTNLPIVESRGYVAAPVILASANGPVFAAVGAPPPAPHYVARGVRATARKVPKWGKGMVAQEALDAAGTYIDSYDSTDPTKSTDGKWDITKRQDNGSVATNSKDPGALDLGGGDIYGSIATGPGGTPVISGGSVGDKAWVDGGRTGVQDGHYTDDMNVEFDPVEPPFLEGTDIPRSGTINDEEYDMVLLTGNYQVNSVNNQRIIAIGKAVLYVLGSIKQSGNSVVEVAPMGSLKMYVGGSADLGGNGIINDSGMTTNFTLFGLPGCTDIKFHGNGEFYGAIYAPNADLTLNGGGSGDQDFSGASVTKSVNFNGHFRFHYDESLARMEMGKGYVVTSWDEMTPEEVANKLEF
jgi:hypothetical protein